MILKYKRNKTSHAVFGLLLLGLLLAFGLTKAGGKQQTPEHEQNTTQNIPASSGKTETQTEGTAVVRGRVLDPDGKPIEGALMVWTTEPNDYWDNRSQAVKTDENGNYQSPELKAIPGAITVIAEGFAPEMKKVRFHSGMKPVDFTLKKGKTLEIHFVDPEGKPVPEVHLSMGGNPDPFWRTDSNIYAGFGADVILGAKIPDTKIPCKADENGVYRWTWAPEDRVRFNFSRENFLPIYTDAYSPEEENWILPGKKVHRITMYPEISASGSVLDADTGKPIGSFRVVPGNIMKNYSPGGIIWQTGQGGEFSGGTFEYHFNAYRKEGYRLRISAEGYDPAVSGDILPGSPNPKFEFRLKKSAGLSAKVLLPDGSPASGAKVFVSGSGGYLQVTDPPNSYLTQDDRMSAQTDAEGRFTIYRDPEERFGIYCEHPKGIGWGTYGEFLKNREIRLHGFAKKIEILLPEKIRETENLRAWLQPEDLGRDGFGHIDYQLIVKPGTKSIVFENIVAGKYEFTLSAPSPSHEWVRGSTAWNLLSASLRIGEDESRVLDLSKPGPTIMGKVVLPDSVSEPMSARDWNYNLAELFFEESGERPIREMRAYLEPSPEDSRVGIFRFDSLPEGEYAVRISVNLYKAPEESRTMDAGFSQPLASFKEELRVSGDRNPLEIELGR